MNFDSRTRRLRFHSNDRALNHDSSASRLWLAEFMAVIAIIGILVSSSLTSFKGTQAEAGVADILAVSDDDVWHNLDQNILSNSVGRNLIQTLSCELYDLQEQALFDVLNNAPLEFTTGFEENAVVLTIPTPNGQFERFAIVEAPVMHPDLAAEFPNIRTYRGQGIDQPAATIRLDYTDHGFHAQILSPDGQYYVDPYFHLQTDLYMSYYKQDLIFNVENADLTQAVYSDRGEFLYGHASHDIHHQGKSGRGFPKRVSVGEVPEDNISPGTLPPLELAPDFGNQLRIYETAVAATGEYTQFWGGTVSAGQSAIVTAINRVTGVYENDVAVRLELVPNNSSIVYTNGATDPYTNNNGVTMLGQNQSNLDSVIGSSNYDVGHAFSTGGGGVALLGVIGQNGAKAQGVSGLPSPAGDGFYIDYVAHELGHQFGGNHTFNGNSGNCSGGNRNGSTAYEPGSGSTIQAYSGICGNDNLQFFSDAMFHSISIDEIRVEVTTGTGNSSATITNTGNTIPVVSAGSNFIIPDQTPFELTATGSDADGNGSLTYSWEQRDLGPQRDVNASDNGSSPIFRTWLPTSDPTRVFPRMTNVLNGTTVVGEQYPTTNWNTMDFRVVLRDNNSGGGGVVSDDMTVRVVNAGTGFDVSSQSTATSWLGNDTETITWNVSGTDSGLINTPTVDILFALDRLNYDIVLAASVPNDGSHEITVPNVDTTQGRVKVKGSGNVFFDVNRANITVVPSSAIPADSLTVFRGNQSGGTLADTADSDDSYVSVSAGFTASSDEAPVWLVFDASLPSDSPNTLDIVLESSAVTPGVFSTTLDVWNWNTNSYDVVDVSNASVGSDTVVTIDLTASISDYVQSGTAAVRSRVGWRVTGLVAQFPWQVQLDQLVWMVNQ